MDFLSRLLPFVSIAWLCVVIASDLQFLQPMPCTTPSSCVYACSVIVTVVVNFFRNKLSEALRKQGYADYVINLCMDRLTPPFLLRMTYSSSTAEEPPVTLAINSCKPNSLSIYRVFIRRTSVAPMNEDDATYLMFEAALFQPGCGSEHFIHFFERYVPCFWYNV